MVSEARTADRLRMSCEHVLSWDLKLVKLSVFRGLFLLIYFIRRIIPNETWMQYIELVLITFVMLVYKWMTAMIEVTLNNKAVVIVDIVDIVVVSNFYLRDAIA